MLHANAIHICLDESELSVDDLSVNELSQILVFHIPFLSSQVP